MMTARQHYDAACAALVGAEEKALGSPAAMQRIAEAQVHMTAAQVLTDRDALDAAHGVPRWSAAPEAGA